jgi:hypothetical protein
MDLTATRKQVSNMAEPTGENVVRGGKTGGLNKYHYNAASGAGLAGWTKVDDNAGAVGMNGEGGDHFAAAEHTGNAGHPQPGTQT